MRSCVVQLAQETRVTIPVVITPRRVIRECKTPADWCKSEFLEQLPVGEKFWVCFIDDKWGIISDCRRVLAGSQFVRLIHCNQGLRRTIEQWESRVKGSHQLVIGSEYTLWIIPLNQKKGHIHLLLCVLLIHCVDRTLVFDELLQTHQDRLRFQSSHLFFFVLCSPARDLV